MYPGDCGFLKGRFMKIAVLAVQGAFIEHEKMLASLGGRGN